MQVVLEPDDSVRDSITLPYFDDLRKLFLSCNADTSVGDLSLYLQVHLTSRRPFLQHWHSTLPSGLAPRKGYSEFITSPRFSMQKSIWIDFIFKLYVLRAQPSSPFHWQNIVIKCSVLHYRFQYRARVFFPSEFYYIGKNRCCYETLTIVVPIHTWWLISSYWFQKFCFLGV